MTEQNLQKHAQFVPPFHFVLLPLALLTFVGSLVNLYRTSIRGSGRSEAALITLISLMLFMAAIFGRVFALKAQDRIIRDEENFRHYLLAGKPLDPRITVDQAIGLRFACDAEFCALCQRAAAENLSRKDIKQAIRTWRVDTYRV